MPKTIKVHHDIDEGVPIPVRMTYPLRSLKVGESFSFPKSKRKSVAPAASKLKAEGKEFTIRVENADTCRVWRTK